MDNDQHFPLSCSDSLIKNTPGSLSKYSSKRSASRLDVFGKNHLRKNKRNKKNQLKKIV
jgi:hypothetical protein